MNNYLNTIKANTKCFKLKKSLRYVAIGLVLVAANVAVADGPYNVSDLGTIGGITSEGWSVNDQGTAVGFGRTAQFNKHAISYSNGVTTDIGTLGGLDSWANGVNNSGVIVGAGYPNSNISTQAFMYSNGVMTDIGTLGGAWSEAFAINNSGSITGTSQPISGSSHAFLYENGHMTDIDPNPTRASIGYAINQSGQIAGRTFQNSVYKAFLYSNGNFQTLPTLGGTHGFANGINDSGSVVGAANASDGFNHPYLYSNGAILDLGTMGGIAGGALDINNQNQIVGGVFKDGESRAFIYQQGGMQDLNDLLVPSGSGWHLTSATSISDTGFITGFGTINGQVHGYLLSPVPEPFSALTLMMGGLGLLCQKRRKAGINSH